MRTRFAPSPTGPLHLGHAFSALTAWDLARRAGGVFLLRIEDADRARCRPEHEAAIYEDLAWLGLSWPEPVLRQSEGGPRYAAALARLESRGLLYPCGCSRADIRAALAAPQEGAGEAVYPGTCRGRAMASRRPGDAIRLRMSAALEAVGDPGALDFTELGSGRARSGALDPAGLSETIGDVVLARRDGTFAYHLTVVVDDAHQGITHVARGRDIAAATPLHRLLQELLGLPVPVWLHHRLIRDESGKRLAKRDDARALSRYRAKGLGAADVRRLVGLGTAEAAR